MLLRPVRLLMLLAVLAAGAAAALKLVAVPFAEDRAAAAIGEAVGGEATVSMDAPLRPALALGEVGDLAVVVRGVKRDGVALRRVDFTVRDADVDLGGLLDRGITLGFAGIDGTVIVTDDALSDVLQRRLRERGVPGTVRLVALQGRAVVRAAGGEETVALRVTRGDTLVVVPTSGGPLASALRQQIDLGPLPYGVRVRAVRIRPGSVQLLIRRPGGRQTLP